MIKNFTLATAYMLFLTPALFATSEGEKCFNEADSLYDTVSKCRQEINDSDDREYMQEDILDGLHDYIISKGKEWAEKNSSECDQDYTGYYNRYMQHIYPKYNECKKPTKMK